MGREREMRIRSFSSQSSAINLANSDPQSNSKKDLAYNYSYFNHIPIRPILDWLTQSYTESYVLKNFLDC